MSRVGNIVKPRGAIKAVIWSRRRVFSFAWSLLCVGNLMLCGHSASGELRAPHADKSLFWKKKRQSTVGKSLQIGTNSDLHIPYVRRIDLIYRPTKNEHLKTALNRQTPTPQGWESYDGSIYNAERGYGWLTNLRGHGRDRGTRGIVILADGTSSSPGELNRPELAHFEGRHGENRPLVFRIDLPDGWYRVTCASVDPDMTRHKPLVDQRSFKCRAHDAVFAGAVYGAATVVGGRQLIESSGIVEVTDRQLRIVVGDPAYPGWTWNYPGPWYTGLKHWWKVEYNYANGWYQRLTRTVDPGFHTLGLNSLEVERVAAPAKLTALVFRDFFNRDDSADVNSGVAPANRWVRVNLHPGADDSMGAELRHTAMTFSGRRGTRTVGAFLQQKMSPATGIVRYSTRVSLFTGEGSQKHSGTHEAGILLLAEPAMHGFNATFVGVQFDSRRAETKGRLIYRVGDGRGQYRINAEVPDTLLPFKITEGEFEVVAEHDVTKNVLRRIVVNGVDVTDRWSLQDRTQRIPRGLFGIRSVIHNTNARVSLEQFYWYYRVESVH